uniref:hypothetical protein n=1 Tax=Ensifer adhaerens TaxID=106592 RepID=UPI003F4923E8
MSTFVLQIWIRTIWRDFPADGHAAVLAASALVASTFYSGTIGLFLASLAVGTVLGPGLNAAYNPRCDEDPSWLGRALTGFGHKKVGDLIVKLISVAVGY